MKMVGKTRLVSMSEAKAKLGQLVDDGKATVLLRHNEPVGAIVSVNDYNELLALKALFADTNVLARLQAQAERARRAPVEDLHDMGDLERFLDEAEARMVKGPRRAGVG